MSNSTHRVNVIRISGDFEVHPNADTLEILHVGGYQLVVKRGNYKAGDLAIYIQPDTIVPAIPQFAFLWEGRTLNADGSVPQRLRRITVKQIRKFWSEGLLMPLSAFAHFYDDEAAAFDVVSYAHWEINGKKISEGDDVADLLGFTHYVDEEPVENIHGEKRSQYQFPPKTLKGWYYWFLRLFGISKGYGGGIPVAGPKLKHIIPVYDVEGFKNFPKAFAEGDHVLVTEKIHGSNARYVFDGKKMHAGSKNLWKAENSTCVWRRALKELPWIEGWCRAHPGYTVYAEVVPTQKGYTYGTSAEAMTIKVFVFDVLTPEGKWMDKASLYFTTQTEGLVLAPAVYTGPFNAEAIKAKAEGSSAVPGANHIREGVVVAGFNERPAPRGLHRMQLKIKGMKFLEREGKNS